MIFIINNKLIIYIVYNIKFALSKFLHSWGLRAATSQSNLWRYKDLWWHDDDHDDSETSQTVDESDEGSD